MTKKFFIAALGAAFAASAFAQVNYVKSINDPIISPATLPLITGTHIASVAVRGDDMFYAGFRSGADGQVVVVRVNNWRSPSPTFTSWVGDSAAAVNGDTKLVIQDNDKLWLATSLTIRNALPTQTEFRRFDFAGTPYTFGAISVMNDGVLSLSELATTSTNISDMVFDPGFSGSPARLGWLVQGSRAVRLIDPDTFTNVIGPALIGNPDPMLSTDLRSGDFTSSGDIYTRANNQIFFNQRTLATGSTFTGLAAQAAVPVAPALTASGGVVQFMNVGFVPASGSNPAMIAYNNRPNNAAGTLGDTSFYVVRADNGAAIGSFGGAIQGQPAYATAIFNFNSANVSGTQYLFVSNNRNDRQGVDVYQVGEDGKVQLNVNLLNYIGASGNRAVAVQVRDAVTDALLDAKTITTTPTAGSLTFYTTARGAVKIRAKANGTVWQSITGTAGASAITGTINIILGDVDNSGEIDAADIDAVIANFGGAPVDPNTYPADVDGSAEVDAADIDIVIGNFGAFDN